MLSFWHLCFSSFPPFFRRGFRLKKRSNALPKWSPAPGRPRCQGRVVFAFTGAQRTPLKGEAGGRAQSSRRKGRQEKGQFRWEPTDGSCGFVNPGGGYGGSATRAN